MQLQAVAASLIALVPLVFAAVGGDRCQVAASAVPTPGLEALAMKSETETVPEAARLTDAQVERLAHEDTKIRRGLEAIHARAEALPPAAKPGAQADVSKLALPELVAHFLGRASRECAILIDAEAAEEFRLANERALRAKSEGDEESWCSLCLAVRRGMEAKFEWEAGRFGALTPAQEKEAAELASMREELRRKWASTLRAELTPLQLTWMREAQMRWLKSTLHASIVAGMRPLGAEKCAACKEQPAVKCQFCSIVLAAVEVAKGKV